MVKNPVKQISLKLSSYLRFSSSATALSNCPEKVSVSKTSKMVKNPVKQISLKLSSYLRFSSSATALSNCPEEVLCFQDVKNGQKPCQTNFVEVKLLFEIFQ